MLARFGQIEAKVLLAADGYLYNGTEYSSLDRLPEILDGLPSAETVLIVPYVHESPDLSGIPRAVLLDQFVAGHAAQEIQFERLPFDHPLYVLFSSGTTGAPKCIVHGAGGVLLQHVKEHRLHCDIRPGDRVCYRPRDTHQLESLRTICSTGSTPVPEGFDYVYEHVKPDVHLASISGGTDLCAAREELHERPFLRRKHRPGDHPPPLRPYTRHCRCLMHVQPHILRRSLHESRLLGSTTVA